ncbi:MAG: MCD, Malonyl-CoA decarboxylase MCD [Rhodobacteraceae bacterium]|nr:MCD, Malonyl-CoA decarboxylase MCD [Paracoccaceae bacterium]
MTPSFLSDLLTRVAIIGRGLSTQTDRTPLADLCATLVTGRGEATSLAVARTILDRYAALAPEGKRAFLCELLTRFGPDPARLDAALAAHQADPGPASLRALHAASEPASQELIRRLNRTPGGTADLVALRADLLGLLREAPELAALDGDFRHLFTSWFNRGFLELRRIDWSTPAEVLEKIIAYEAVHEIRGWDDLRRRVAAPDRRLYAFFHPALRHDPLIFVEVALTAAVPGAIGPILAEDRPPVAPGAATTAVFYSISNCQKGLRGISFGNFLIKQVVEELRRDFDTLTTFVTLSPVPGLRSWAEAEAARDDPRLTPGQRALVAHLAQSPEATDDPALASLAARYLAMPDSPGAGARDPVARFHLGNGARLDRIHLMADPSANGVKASWGVMVNYLYDLGAIERNHEAFATRGEIIAAPAIQRLGRATK